MKKDKEIHIRVDALLQHEIKQTSWAEHKGISDYCREILETHLQTIENRKKLKIER